MYGILHSHSTYSLLDSSMSVDDYIKKGKEMGASALALTEHGNMLSAYEFYTKCNNNNIKPILGMEGYINDNDNLDNKHILFLCKNYKGYNSLCKYIKDTYSYMESNKPTGNKELLLKHFKNNKNIIISSACVGGILSKILLHNQIINKKLNKLNENLGDLDELVEQEKELKAKIDTQNAALEELKTRKQYLSGIKDKKFKLRENRALKITDEKAKKEELDKIKKEQQEQQDAIKEIDQIVSQIEKIKKKLKPIKSDYSKIVNKIKTRENKKTDCETLKTLSQKEIDEHLNSEIMFYKNNFPNFYIELQYHNLEEEKKVFPILAQKAKELNVPTIITNDIHETNKDNTYTRKLLTSLMFVKWEGANSSDTELYMKSDEEIEKELSKILNDIDINKAKENTIKLIEECNIKFPNVKHYPKFSEDSKKLLKEIAVKNIPKLFPEGTWTKEYQDRFDNEYEIICSMGFADYLLINEDFIKFANDFEKEQNEGLGVGCGLGRGSACGSLLCYLLGITKIDPIKYQLFFERFLNPERVTMPDIDTDISPDIVDDVVNYVSERYGKDEVIKIRTIGICKPKSAIRNMARIVGDKYENNSLYYKNLAEKIAKDVPEGPDISFDTPVGENESFTIYNQLMQKYEKDKIAKEILKYAKRIENCAINTSLHAAGVIIGDGTGLSKYVPVLYSKDKECFGTQFYKDECEEIGLLKMDFLKLDTLRIINKCLKNIKKAKGIHIEFDDIPIEKEIITNIYGKANTDGIFQFEADWIKRTLKRFKPETIEDITLLNALNRPGPQKFADDIIDIKNKIKEPNYVIPQMSEVLGNTYGYPIYQEQVMQIFNRFAGFSFGEADIIRRYMSKKKPDKFLAYKDKFVQGLIKNGASENGANEFWEQLVDFSKYAFNKSHAVAYSVLSYKLAYLKYYYKEEFYAAVMSVCDKDKLPIIIRAMEMDNIKLKLPSINYSNSDFTPIGEGVVFGLSSIPYMANKSEQIIAERKIKRFENLTDFIIRCNINTMQLQHLAYSGALDDFNIDRQKLVNNIDNISNLIKKKTAKLKKIEDETLLFQTLKKKADKLRCESRINNAKTALQKIKCDEQNIMRNIIKEGDITEAEVLKEYEELHAFVSRHPLDKFDRTPRTDIKDIPKEINHKLTIIGIVDKIHNVKTKNGDDMAFITVADKTGNTELVVFQKTFAKYEEDLFVGNVLCFHIQTGESGSAHIVEVIDNEPDVKECFVIFTHKAETIKNYVKYISKYQDAKGYKLYACTTEWKGKLKKCNMGNGRVSADILNEKALRGIIRKF